MTETKTSLNAEQLTDAFRAFNQLSEDLTSSYQGLEEQVEKLHQELAAARSERLKTLDEKEALAARLQQLLGALPAAIVILDVKGEIVDCNAQANNFLGDSLVGQQWEELAQLRLLSVLDNPLERQLLNGLRVNIISSSLPETKEQVIVLSDVSEMNALQESLNQKKHLSAMGEMVASMAHQVRTPLSTAILYASQLSHPAVTEEKRQRFSKRILERLHYLERQVNDMLVFAKEGRLAMEGFSLQDLINQLNVSMLDTLSAGKVQFQIENNCPIDAMNGNIDALHGAIMNLINNGLEAIPEEGRIECIVAQADKQHIEIKIRDSGVGMDEQQLKRIFEPFFTTRTAGTGLGLAVVDSVVKAHGGKISCVSKLGEGTEFKLQLKCIEQNFAANLSNENI